jgi:hypothetical protein
MILWVVTSCKLVELGSEGTSSIFLRNVIKHRHKSIDPSPHIIEYMKTNQCCHLLHKCIRPVI